MSVASNVEYKPEAVHRQLNLNAKWWWGASNVLRFVGFVLGGVAIFLPVSPVQLAVMMVVVSVGTEVASYRSDAVKGMAKALRRKLDLKDSLGWPISGAEWADLLARSPASVRRQARKDVSMESYFDSRKKPGPKRAVENIRESAWWSKHLSESLSEICLALLLIALFASVVALAIAADKVAPVGGALATASRTVVACLMFFISLGPARLAVAYYGAAKKAGQIEKSADVLLEVDSITESDAVKLYYEYHLSRAAAPLVPEWYWKLKRKELNEMWAARRG